MQTSKKRLSNTIFSTVLVFSIVIVAFVICVISALYYITYEKDAENKLVESAEQLATKLNDTDQTNSFDILENELTTSMRYTFINSDGVVLYDSASDVSSLDNHNNRPEVELANDVGVGSITRYSDTLHADTIYAAVKLDDGNIIRISETRDSLFSFFNIMLPFAILILAVLVILVIIFSKILTKRIMVPFGKIKISDPIQNTSYVEMEPLINRINDQQHRLVEQNKELKRAENMRRDFSANVSHEMKTPLQVISGYSELLTNDLVKPEDEKRILSIINEEANHMRVLIDDVLVLSRLDEPMTFNGQTDQIDILALAYQVAKRLKPLAYSREISLKVYGSNLIVEGSQTLLEQILYNLISNAIRYNKDGGEVVVTITKDCHVEDLEVPPDVKIRVRDTGCGIPQKDQTKIFQRFYRVDKSRSKKTGGTGLGLAIVKHAVEYHKGSIEVKSEIDEGSIFTITLPLS